MNDQDFFAALQAAKESDLPEYKRDEKGALVHGSPILERALPLNHQYDTYGADDYYGVVPGGVPQRGIAALVDRSLDRGMAHPGVDIRSWGVDPTRAGPQAGGFITPTAPGVVSSVNFDGNGGVDVRVINDDGTLSTYGHLDYVNVKPGQAVSPNMMLGTMGPQKGFNNDLYTEHLHYNYSTPYSRGQPVTKDDIDVANEWGFEAADGKYYQTRDPLSVISRDALYSNRVPTPKESPIRQEFYANNPKTLQENNWRTAQTFADAVKNPEQLPLSTAEVAHRMNDKGISFALTSRTNPENTVPNPNQYTDAQLDRITDMVLGEMTSVSKHGLNTALKDAAMIAATVANRRDVLGRDAFTIATDKNAYNAQKPAPGTEKYRDRVKEIVKGQLTGTEPRATRALAYSTPETAKTLQNQLPNASLFPAGSVGSHNYVELMPTKGTLGLNVGKEKNVPANLDKLPSVIPANYDPVAMKEMTQREMAQYRPAAGPTDTAVAAISRTEMPAAVAAGYGRSSVQNEKVDKLEKEIANIPESGFGLMMRQPDQTDLLPDTYVPDVGRLNPIYTAEGASKISIQKNAPSEIGNTVYAYQRASDLYESSTGSKAPGVNDAVAKEGTSRERETPNSQHFAGKALDIDVTGMSDAEKQNLVSSLQAAGFNSFGFGERIVHADRRLDANGWPVGSTWTYGGIKSFGGIPIADWSSSLSTGKLPQQVISNVNKAGNLGVPTPTNAQGQRLASQLSQYQRGTVPVSEPAAIKNFEIAPNKVETIKYDSPALFAPGPTTDKSVNDVMRDAQRQAAIDSIGKRTAPQSAFTADPRLNMGVGGIQKNAIGNMVRPDIQYNTELPLIAPQRTSLSEIQRNPAALKEMMQRQLAQQISPAKGGQLAPAVGIASLPQKEGYVTMGERLASLKDPGAEAFKSLPPTYAPAKPSIGDPRQLGGLRMPSQTPVPSPALRSIPAPSYLTTDAVPGIRPGVPSGMPAAGSRPNPSQLGGLRMPSQTPQFGKPPANIPAMGDQKNNMRSLSKQPDDFRAPPPGGKVTVQQLAAAKSTPSFIPGGTPQASRYANPYQQAAALQPKSPVSVAPNKPAAPLGNPSQLGGLRMPSAIPSRTAPPVVGNPSQLGGLRMGGVPGPTQQQQMAMDPRARTYQAMPPQYTAPKAVSTPHNVPVPTPAPRNAPSVKGTPVQPGKVQPTQPSAIGAPKGYVPNTKSPEYGKMPDDTGIKWGQVAIDQAKLAARNPFAYAAKTIGGMLAGGPGGFLGILGGLPSLLGGNGGGMGMPTFSGNVTGYQGALAGAKAGNNMVIGRDAGGNIGWGGVGGLSAGAAGAGWASNNPERNYGGYGGGYDPTPV